MALVTTIRWRPYPEQKPEDGDFHPVRYLPEDESDPQAIALLAFREGAWYDEDEDFDHSENVTHFALPEDIVTEEAP